MVADYTNLYYACQICNTTKGSRWPDERLAAGGFVFLDPCQLDPYLADLREENDGRLEALTPAGQYTLLTLRLNRDECVEFRLDRRRLIQRIQECRATLAGFESDHRLFALLTEIVDDLQREWGECFGAG